MATAAGELWHIRAGLGARDSGLVGYAGVRIRCPACTLNGGAEVHVFEGVMEGNRHTQEPGVGEEEPAGTSGSSHSRRRG